MRDMKCKNGTCNKQVTGRKHYCNDACRMAYKRAQPEQSSTLGNPDVRVNDAKSNETPLNSVAITPQNEQKPLSGSGNTDDKNLEQPTEWEKIKARLPGSVQSPTGTPTAATKTMTGQQLHHAVSTYTGQGWQASNEYAEICSRLITWTVAELIEDGQRIPQWKVNP
jgi:hypothetical protein